MALSRKQGYELARVGTKMGLPVELQRLIWADVTKNYYSRGSVIDRAALVLQVAWRRLRAILAIPNRVVWIWMVGPSCYTRYLGACQRVVRFECIVRYLSATLTSPSPYQWSVAR